MSVFILSALLNKPGRRNKLSRFPFPFHNSFVVSGNLHNLIASSTGKRFREAIDVAYCERVCTTSQGNLGKGP